MKKRNSDKLQSAMESLDNALAYSRTSEFQGLGIEFKSIIISSVVQNYSLTFHVCTQMITRQLADKLGKVAESYQPQQLFAVAAEEGLISDLGHWLEYLDCELLTQSTNIALRTFEKASAFLEDAAELLTTCQLRTNNERRSRDQAEYRKAA